MTIVIVEESYCTIRLGNTRGGGERGAWGGQVSALISGADSMQKKLQYHIRCTVVGEV